MQADQWYARQMFSGDWDIADETTGETIARTKTEHAARLIEAAPAMLVTLEAVIQADILERGVPPTIGRGPMNAQRWADAQAIIAQARGEAVTSG